MTAAAAESRAKAPGTPESERVTPQEVHGGQRDTLLTRGKHGGSPAADDDCQRL